MIRRLLLGALLATCIAMPARPAAAQQCPTTLNALTNWYEASPGFSDVATVRMTATFTNAAGADMVFSPTSGTFQLWSVPSVLDIPVEVVEEPSGIVLPGGTVQYDLILNVSALPPSETTFALRQVDNDMFGTMAPELIPLQSVAFSCTLAVPATTPWSVALLVLCVGVVTVTLLRRQARTSPAPSDQ